jgi:hypothetical protein
MRIIIKSNIITYYEVISDNIIFCYFSNDYLSYELKILKDKDYFFRIKSEDYDIFLCFKRNLLEYKYINIEDFNILSISIGKYFKNPQHTKYEKLIK